MTFNELLKRPNGFYFSPPADIGGGIANLPIYLSPVDDGGAEEEDDLPPEETDEEREAREAQEAADAQYQADVQAAAQRLHEEAVERKAAELQARLAAGNQTQPDPNALYRQRLQEIADELDPVRQEEMRMALAEERVAARFQPQLAHSSYEGAVQNVFMHEKDIPENVKPFVAQAIREYGVNPQQTLDPAGAKQVRRIAAGLAAEAGVFNPQPTPAPRTPTLRPAPVTGQTRPTGGILSQLNEREKAVVNANWNALPASMREGKRIEDIFSQDDLMDILSEVR